MYPQNHSFLYCLFFGFVFRWVFLLTKLYFSEKTQLLHRLADGTIHMVSWLLYSVSNWFTSSSYFLLFSHCRFLHVLNLSRIYVRVDVGGIGFANFFPLECYFWHMLLVSVFCDCTIWWKKNQKIQSFYLVLKSRINHVGIETFPRTPDERAYSLILRGVVRILNAWGHEAMMLMTSWGVILRIPSFFPAMKRKISAQSSIKQSGKSLNVMLRWINSLSLSVWY